MPVIENEAAGWKYELPALTQGCVEEFYRERRKILAGMKPVDARAFSDELADFVGVLAKTDMSSQKFEAALREYRSGMLAIERGASEPSNVEANGAIVRAMARLGWLDDVAEDDIAGMKPAKVFWLAQEFDRLIDEAFTLPKN